ncbi:HNH endonuclease [Bacteroidia bacterium]|nr:HNH endonuclease [Bacteroidia bacterium]
MDVFVSKNEVNEWHIKNYGRGTSTPEAPDESDSRTRHITQEVKDDVWNRDNGQCVVCASNENLEFDHIIPFSEGGANTYRNIQLLCQNCNRSKSNSIG